MWAKGARRYWIEMGPASKPHKARPRDPNLFLRCYGRQNITVSLNPTLFSGDSLSVVKNLCLFSIVYDSGNGVSHLGKASLWIM